MVPEAQGGRRHSNVGPAAAGSRGPRLHQRSEILAEISDILAGTCEHPKCPIVIEGLNGTGKTALLNASLKAARDLGLRVGRAQCDAAESSAQFGVIRQVFSSMLHQMAIPDEPLHDGTDLARRVLRSRFDPTDDPVDVYQSLMLLLETTGEGPVLVGVDDIQWADAMSAGWLRFLARRLDTASVHLVVTMDARRVGASGVADPIVLDAGTRRYTTHPLGLEATLAMLGEHLGTPTAHSIAETAHRVTGGSPLLIARMLSALDDLGTPAAMISEDQIASLVSPVVAHTVSSLVSTLPAGANDLVEALAVLRVADLPVAAEVAGIDMDQALTLADELADVGVLSWERPIEFATEFERNSLYDEIQPARLADLHARAAHVLAVLDGDVTETARHLLETETRGDEWAQSVLVDAARQHLRSGDTRTAAHLLERADREASGNMARAEIARLRARADGRRDLKSAVEHLRRAGRLGLDPVALADTALDLLDQAMPHSAHLVLLEMAQRARQEFVDPQPETELRLQLAESVFAAGKREPAMVEFHELPSASPSTEFLLAAQRVVRAATHLDCTHDQLVDALRSLLTPEVLRGHGFVHTAIVAAALSALVKVGAYETADALLLSATTAAGADHRRLDTIAYTIVRVESLAMQGRIVEAERALADVGFEQCDAFSQCATMQARWLAALRERPGHASTAVRVIPISTTPGLAELGASAAMFVAESTARIQLLDLDYTDALANFDNLETAAQRYSIRNPAFATWRPGRCAALGAIGRVREGAALADELLELARKFGSPVTIAEALACVARFRPPEEQVVLLGEALNVISRTDAELLRCSLLIDLGFARHHAGDQRAARTAFRDGADHAARFGVTRLAGVAGRGLLACGARPRRLQMSGQKSLTPAELRVVELAVAGHTNAAIAESLFINVKTVESHLTRAYRKLGIGDRAELKDALAANDGVGFKGPKPV